MTGLWQVQYWAGDRETLIQTGDIWEDFTKQAKHKLELENWKQMCSGKKKYVKERWGGKEGNPGRYDKNRTIEVLCGWSMVFMVMG